MDSEPQIQENVQKQNEPIYKFDQTLQNVTVYCPIKPGTRAKMIDVQFGPTNLKVKYKYGVPEDEFLINGELFNQVVVNDCTWSIVDQKELSIHLEKKKKDEWWPHVLKSDPKIDIRQLEPEKSRLSDLDEETRATVEKMMYDQKQQQQNQGFASTTGGRSKQDILEQFKAQHPELDFSKVNMSDIE